MTPEELPPRVAALLEKLLDRTPAEQEAILAR
jgi:hypothetical protein